MKLLLYAGCRYFTFPQKLTVPQTLLSFFGGFGAGLCQLSKTGFIPNEQFYKQIQPT